MLAGAHIPPDVLATLQRSCGDCHSEATHYPWYSYVAPVAWLIQNDVSSGRRHLNFSKWNAYPLLRRQRLLSEIANQVRDGEMPLFVYTLMHRQAKLSQTDVNAIFEWTQVERSRLIVENTCESKKVTANPSPSDSRLPKELDPLAASTENPVAQ
jgi:hypothetical protein